MRTPAPLMSLTVDRFIDEVSNETPAPGGGSVAALSGSLSAALSAMVANVTVGKAGYESVWEPLSALSERAQLLKVALARAVDEDTQAFNGVIEANRLPKATPEQQAARAEAIDRAYQQAAQVPLGSARLCLQALEIARDAADHGNRNSTSDAGVAALEARAGVEGSVLNVLTNLGSIKDEAFKRSCREEAERLRAEAVRSCEEVLARIHSTLAG